jgi:uncharacterized pyridoxal phosphate-dependent enzyme
MSSQSNIYARLGIKPIINAQGTWTVLGGSLMPPEVLSAMAEASRFFVSIPELQEKVGARIAGLLGVPASMVTAGAASAIAIATAACIAREDPQALERLPDTTGLKNEVVIQTSHQDGYEPQIRLSGAKIKMVDSRADLERVIGPKTAMLFFTNRHESLGQIKRDEWLEIAKRHQIPTLIDAAADVPPVSRFREYLHQGFDLVAFSGGKAIRGPQASGLLVGDPGLIGLAQQVISPSMGLGRAMKVGKEEIVGLLVALERFVALDHDAEWRLWQTRAREIATRLESLPGTTVRIDVPEIANHSPHVLLDWSHRPQPIPSNDFVHLLRDGDPPIAVLGEGPHGLRIAVWTLQDGEHLQVVARIHEILASR